MQHARVTSFDGSPEYRQQMDRQNERALVAWFAEMHGRTLHARRNARDFGLVHRSVRHSARWCGQLRRISTGSVKFCDGGRVQEGLCSGRAQQQ
jgi:hypothetical protein